MKIPSQGTCSYVIQILELVALTSSCPFVLPGFVTQDRFASLREELDRL